MVNSKDFSKRLKEIFDYYDLSASSFADKIDVGRASISHILSGRNKPSLDFVMKVVSSFEEVELYWLLNGKGHFPPADQNEDNTLEKPTDDSDDSKAVTSKNDRLVADMESQPKRRSGKDIEKVIIFYADGSFESYENYPKT
ncbi:helix-turn-helix transcriptional regulator [Psychroflexus sp. YR1-1]|uniref:Helix-turn-helix transcriptional regulator n=1 Tax=Psychroflexus aurantiacus TaxID=2709310 RepID=A0A6B3R537_9FLAO|nr:helix-turn-helix transcriptional regulator [Psychroflexus aurantiacus]NEV94287.1 helix-turn-helix transcriptional regulator [Psychroflexus aurantiacus]